MAIWRVLGAPWYVQTGSLTPAVHACTSSPCCILDAWAATITSFDAFVFVSPEYNHSSSAALKNAIDFLFAEWNDKAAGLVTYGVDGGVRAAEHLRLVLGELKVADVRSAVSLCFGVDFEGFDAFTPRDVQRENVTGMLDELVAWARALRPIREPAPVG